MQANSWHHKLFHFHLSFVSGKSGKKGKKLQKFEYLENKKSFFEEIKKALFIFLWGGGRIHKTISVMYNMLTLKKIIRNKTAFQSR